MITEKPPLPTYNPPVTLVTVGQALADPFYFENQLFEGLSELLSLMMQKSDAPTSNSFTPANGWPLPNVGTSNSEERYVELGIGSDGSGR